MAYPKLFWMGSTDVKSFTDVLQTMQKMENLTFIAGIAHTSLWWVLKGDFSLICCCSKLAHAVANVRPARVGVPIKSISLNNNPEVLSLIFSCLPFAA